MLVKECLCGAHVIYSANAGDLLNMGRQKLNKLSKCDQSVDEHSALCGFLIVEIVSSLHLEHCHMVMVSSYGKNGLQRLLNCV